MSMGRLSMVAKAVGGTLVGSDAEFAAVSTDTRSLQPGELFFALRGASNDGNAFVAEAARLGAAGAVVSARQPGTLPQVEVADTRLALGELARAWRARFSLPLIGITGSNGKTTVKEMTAAIMRAAFGGSVDPLLVTWGNLNNEIGLPRTLLYLNETHRAAVIEMGAAKRGDIAYLARIACPTVAVVTNAARAHLQGFGSIDEVAATKGEIYDFLPATGTAVINRDDRFFHSWWERSAGRQRLGFGLHPDADFRATDIVVSGTIGFTLHGPGGALPVRLAMAGAHNVLNALAAAAAAHAAGAKPAAIAAGLAAVRNVAGRLRRVPARQRFTLYDDSYNANPGSVRAAIAFLGSQAGERWLVLGDMAELGPDSLQMHREMGECARLAGISRLYCAGSHSQAAAEAFGRNARHFSEVPALAAALAGEVRPGITMLVKGSRSMGMERVVQALAADGSPAGE
ncbi:MAG: UDP-N-acetylmuramoyl-tripeptide--D-alanyl-D-alanine ligase [Proteobacteria bacterium]|nr:MAG: UDP-N-acetylmuramoyl-tripeptide--D-alanyl-D-alanine ligase [Pseudomonadota bacterium]MBC6944719.1 UDP-N-acetylmuramoyl-tripeptide--D-alanyl-D-alanine ligase [Gammaproteobacteria bacterium]MCE7895859.1 UDP-N-acetylmuramoyl-tripeptide--D-alanyl-D-alanine ligase [Gammaproteobacteria bacterium PRO8]MCQ3934203.1 UDP-N-acetylmuramoyl-tripeptide--D-alanyl-D-alanine ligase [Gammaproteobacteria bacterium]MDL1881192.1 UDP-N-acetylmuramoyl-tripeptide--D-alanyl-D-alanine ligase [Gammaproteobacteria